MRRGMALVGILWYAAFVLTVMLATAAMVENVRGGLTAQRYAQEAACMARSGTEYAQYMIRSRKWQSATHFQSPDMQGCGTFRVDAMPAGGGWKVRVIGRAGSATQTLERTLP